MAEPVFMGLDMCIMALMAISTVYFINSSSLSVARQLLGKNFRVVARQRLFKNVKNNE
jgi:hypothetical protein